LPPPSGWGGGSWVVAPVKARNGPKGAGRARLAAGREPGEVKPLAKKGVHEEAASGSSRGGGGNGHGASARRGRKARTGRSEMAGWESGVRWQGRRRIRGSGSV